VSKQDRTGPCLLGCKRSPPHQKSCGKEEAEEGEGMPHQGPGWSNRERGYVKAPVSAAADRCSLPRAPLPSLLWPRASGFWGVRPVRCAAEDCRAPFSLDASSCSKKSSLVLIRSNRS
jgi:hypothetical protein